MSSKVLFDSNRIWFGVIYLVLLSRLASGSFPDFDFGYSGLSSSEIYCSSDLGCPDILLGSVYRMEYPKITISFRSQVPDAYELDCGHGEACGSKYDANHFDEDEVIEESLNHRCSSSHYSEVEALKAHPFNCSLFFKCDWGAAVTFECPEDLHFNAELQVCDWPWQANCDPSWSRCPRPSHPCPPRHPKPLYLPHPRRCDRFYQCDWGKSHLQNCPTGLHFNPRLKICDWPHKANCHVC